MTHQIRFQIAVFILLGSLSLLLLAGCGKKSGDTQAVPSSMSIVDQAQLISPNIVKKNLSPAEVKARKLSVCVAIITEPSVNSREPGAYVDRVFESTPTFQKVSGKGKRRVVPYAYKDVWHRRGILVYVSIHPRLIQVRLGSEVGRIIPDERLYRLLALEVYPVADRGSLGAAIAAAVNGVLDRTKEGKLGGNKPGALESLANTGISIIKDHSYPEKRLYYWVAFDPLINSIGILLTLAHGQMWVIIVWLILLHVLLRRDVTGKLIQSINSGLLRVTFPIWGHFIRPRDRIDQVLGNVQVISNIEGQLVRIGMGVPVYAVLTLVMNPFRENVTTAQFHLYQWAKSWVQLPEMFTIRGGFFSWSLHAPAGIVFAVVFAFFSLVSVIPDFVLTMVIGNMSLQDIKEKGIPYGTYAMDKAKVEAIQAGQYGFVFGSIFRAIAIPIASAYTPFLFALYYLIQAVESSFSSVKMAVYWKDWLTGAKSGKLRPTADQKKALQEFESYNNAFNAQDYAGAYEHAERLVKLSPFETAGYYILAKALVGLGRLEEACSKLEYACKIDPMLDYFGEQIDLRKELIQMKLLLACSLCAENPTRALKIAQSVTSDGTDLPEVRFVLGLANMRNGKVDEGLQMARAVAAESPNHPLIAEVVKAIDNAGGYVG